MSGATVAVGAGTTGMTGEIGVGTGMQAGTGTCAVGAHALCPLPHGGSQQEGRLRQALRLGAAMGAKSRQGFGGVRPLPGLAAPRGVTAAVAAAAALAHPPQVAAAAVIVTEMLWKELEGHPNLRAGPANLSSDSV